MHDLRIGDRIILGGRKFVVCGFDPMSLPERTAQLEDAETGTISRVPVALLPASAGDGTLLLPETPPGVA